MAELKKVRVQLINAITSEVEEEVNVMTSPNAVLFSDGKTLTEKLNSIELTPGAKGDTGAQGIQGANGIKGDTGAQGIQGAKGDKGDTGARGIQGAKGDKGESGDTIKVGADVASAVQKKLFFKVV